MSQKNQGCFVCGHPSAKLTEFNVLLCSCCKIVEETSENGKMKLIYGKTIGEDNKRLITQQSLK